jgi:soluble lytic murein transglycosylase-like protein
MTPPLLPPSLLTALLLSMQTGHPDAALQVAAAQQAGVPPIVALSVVEVESGRKLLPPDGAAGEVGRWQVRPELWGASFTRACGAASLRDPVKNACVGAHILRGCYDRLGSWPLAVRCFNGDIRDRRTARYLAKVERALGRLTLRITP